MSEQWLEAQRRLRAMGYGLGSTGPARDGVDGVPGDLTAAAVLAVLMKLNGQLNLPPAATYDREALKAELIRDEGERLKAYRDSVGKWSAGVGRNLDDVGIRPDEAAALGITTASVRANGLTQIQSRYLLDSDINHVEAALDERLPMWRHLDPVRQRVLLNMCFNMGIGTLLGFVNTLGMIGRGDYAGAAKNMLLSKWAHQVGERAKRLSKMMESGA